MKKIKPVVTEKLHFDERVESFLIKFLEDLDFRNFDARINIIGFQINLCFKGSVFSIEVLLEENKPEVKEGSVVEFREISKKF